MSKPNKLAHVVMRTSQYQEMIDWYKVALDAHVTFQNEILSFLTYDEEHHRVAILHIPGLAEAPAGQAGLDHVAFCYTTLKDLLEHYKALKAVDIVPFWCINHGPTTSMYYRDPDGNQVEFQVENFDTLEQSTKFFHSDEFGENPIGVDFDADELFARLQAGASETELKKRPNIGPRSIGDDVPLQ